MAELFSGLLVSCPNEGGLFYLDGRRAIKMDNLDTTGLGQSGGRILRGLQPDRVYMMDGIGLDSAPEPVVVPDIHDVLIDEGVQYVVGTLENEVLELSSDGHELRRFTFPGEQDSWHLNCIARFSGRVIFSAFGDCREHRAYKLRPVGSGFVQDLHTGERLIIGLSQPHSLVRSASRLLLANSYEGELHEYDKVFRLVRKQGLGGYVRGILVDGDTIYVGLSCSRNREEGVECATLLALDSKTWAELGRLSLPTNEIYDVLKPKAADLPAILAMNASLASRVLGSRSIERERSLNEEIVGLQQLTSSQEARLNELAAELQRRNASEDDLRRQLEQARDRLRDREVQWLTDLNAKGSYAEELHRQMDEERNQFRQREGQLWGELKTRNDALDGLRAQLDQKCDEFQQREAEISGKLQERIALADDLRGQLSRKAEQAQQRETQILDELHAKITLAEDLRLQLAQKTDEFQQREAQISDELQERIALVGDLRRQLSRETEEAQQRETQILGELHAKIALAEDLRLQLADKTDEFQQRESQILSQLQARIALSDQLSLQLNQKSDAFQQREEQLLSELRAKTALATSLELRLDRKKDEFQEREAQLLSELQGKTALADNTVIQLDLKQAEITRQSALSRELGEQLLAKDAEINQLDHLLGDLRTAIADREAYVDLVHASLSWRITAPLRSGKALLRRLASGAYRVIAAPKHVLRDAPSRRKYLSIARRLGPVGAARQAAQFIRRGGPSPEVRALPSPPVFDLRKTGECGVVVLSTMHCRYVAELLISALERAGIAARAIYEVPEGAYDDVPHFVICPQMFDRLPGLYVSFQMEQSVSTRWFTPNYLHKLENSFAIFDYSLHNIATLEAMGLHARQFYYMPIGHLPGYGSDTLSTEKEYDVLFYGDINNERRRSCIAELQKVCRVKVVSNLFGQAMVDELRRARVVVNIHYYAGALLESTRLWECLSLDCLVVSERSCDMDQHEDLQSLVDFVDEGDFIEMAARVQHWLHDESVRRARVDQNAVEMASLFNRFDYYFFRFLLASGNITFEDFWQLIGSEYPLPSDKLCLNLPEFTDRAASFDRDNRYEFNRFPGLRHATGWIGCALSYKYMIRLAMKQGLPSIVICEDDVEFPDNFGTTWPAVSSYLRDNSGRWNIFSGLMTDLHRDAKVFDVSQQAGYEFVTTNKLISMVFNVYDQTCYASIAGWDECNEDVTTNTIDRYLEAVDSLKVLTISPFLVGHKEDLYSTLWGGRNTIYTDMISKSEALLQEKVARWYRKNRKNRKQRHPAPNLSNDKG